MKCPMKKQSSFAYQKLLDLTSYSQLKVQQVYHHKHNQYSSDHNFNVGASISLDLSSLDDISSNNYNDRIERCKKSYILGYNPIFVISIIFIINIKGINPKKANTLEELKSIIIKEFKRVCVLNITNREGYHHTIFKYRLF